MPTRERRTHASITIPLSSTRSNTSSRLAVLGLRSTRIADPPERLGLAGGRGRQPGAEQMAAADVVPDHPPAGGRRRALGPEINDSRGGVTQQLDGAPVERRLLPQRRLVAREALLDGRRLARHLTE